MHVIYVLPTEVRKLITKLKIVSYCEKICLWDVLQVLQVS